MSATVPALAAATQGFALGGSLIVAIGAQNAFVLRQGLRREHVLPVVVFCVVADAALMLAGVAGLATVLGHRPELARALTLGGALFLSVYGLRALWRARRPGSLDVADDGRAVTLGAAMAQCAAFTLLNPHVYGGSPPAPRRPVACGSRRSASVRARSRRGSHGGVPGSCSTR